MEVEFPACYEVWDASWRFSLVSFLLEQLCKGCPLVQIYEHGDGEQEHVLLHSGHLLTYFWEERRTEALSRLQGKVIVVLGA